MIFPTQRKRKTWEKGPMWKDSRGWKEGGAGERGKGSCEQQNPFCTKSKPAQQNNTEGNFGGSGWKI